VTTVIAVLAALGAACCFALAAVVQHGAARETGEKLLSLRLLLALVRNPRWLAGVALGVLSFAVQGLALAFGPLALVQPLAATDVLFALPMIAVLHRYRLTRGDWLGAGAVAGGIALFFAVSPPSEGTRAPGLAAWAPVILAAGAFAAVAGLAAMRARGPAQVIWLAAGAGITYGVLDALTKSTVDLLADRGFTTLLRWEPYALLAAGILGTLLSQSAFRAGALSVSLPVIDTRSARSSLVPLCSASGWPPHPASSPPNWQAGPWPRPASPHSAAPRWPRWKPAPRIQPARVPTTRFKSREDPRNARGGRAGRSTCHPKGRRLPHRRLADPATWALPRATLAWSCRAGSADAAHRIAQSDVPVAQPLRRDQAERERCAVICPAAGPAVSCGSSTTTAVSAGRRAA